MTLDKMTLNQALKHGILHFNNQQNAIEHNHTQQKAIKHNKTQQNDIQHNATQLSTKTQHPTL